MSESADNSRAATNNITAGWKHDIDRCIRADRRLTSSEKIVAEAIVDFMNAKTRATFRQIKPSPTEPGFQTTLSYALAQTSKKPAGLIGTSSPAS